eukprot:8453270-Pyramimonas_sp.AAC.1
MPVCLVALPGEVAACTGPDDAVEKRVVAGGELVHLDDAEELAAVVDVVSNVADELFALLACLQACGHDAVVPSDRARGGAAGVEWYLDLHEHRNVV